MIDIREISKRFGTGNSAVTALHDISLTIGEGEFFTLLGPSGCGKTTLLRLIAGFEPPSGGALILDGQDIAQMPPNKRPVNTVFQNYALFPHMTVAQNVAFALQAQGRPKAEVAGTVDEMLALVQMAHLRDRKSGALSGGQQQRVALARALAPKPRILLLDEPLSALDFKLRKDMQIELKRLQTETGITFIFVTHDQEEALTMSDRIAVMSAGKIQQIGAPRDIYMRPINRFVADFIGDINILPAQISGGKATIQGVAFVLNDSGPARAVNVAIRPEQLRLLAANSPDSLAATVTQTVYFGTDSHVHLALANGQTLIARLQAGGDEVADGTQVGISFAANALQVLED